MKSTFNEEIDAGELLELADLIQHSNGLYRLVPGQGMTEISNKQTDRIISALRQQVSTLEVKSVGPRS